MNLLIGVVFLSTNLDNLDKNLYIVYTAESSTYGSLEEHLHATLVLGRIGA